MNAERLLEHYERIADAPVAIPRLRRFVLDLAVRGKLVPQDPNDEPATELLKRIEKEKASKRHKDAPALDGEEELLDLPHGWCAVPLIALGTWAIGAGFPKSEQGASDGPFMFLKVSDMNLPGNEKIITVANNFIDERAAQRMRAKIHLPGTIIFPKIGGAIATNKRRILTIGAAIDNNCLGITFSPHIDTEWAYLLLTNLDFMQYQAGTAVPALQQGTLEKIPIAVPPLAEQHRIVAKVDELMALCDRLEAARGSREAVRDRLAAASLARLNAPDPETFQADARFVLDALPALTARADQIKQLRETILGLAVVGKLTASGNTAPPASIELDAVKVRKEQLKLRRPKKIDPIAPDEYWCKLPNGWVWARWDQITDWITYGFTRPMPHTNDGVPIITGKNVNQGKIVFETADRTPITSYRELNDKDRPKRGDILITKDGSIGRTAIVDTDEPFCINQSVAVLWLQSCHSDRRFLQLALDCPQAQQLLLAKTEGVAIKHISIIDLGKMVFPVPPIAEQRRIVAKVDELMALCDWLEASLTSTAATCRRLLDALLAEALAPVDDMSDDNIETIKQVLHA